MLSGFKVVGVDGVEKVVPVMYGDISRQGATVLRDNSENKLPSAPRISVYISDLQLDQSRLADASYINKLFIRERGIDPTTNTYVTTQGQNYTIERLMPTPYKLNIKADIWTTNTEQKLQVLEQILVLFNPSFEIQTTDNYVDWTSLTAIYLEDIVFTNRSIPVGTDSDIDVATVGFETPIWITPPGKITRMGIIQTIISNIFNESGQISPDFIYGQSSNTVYVTPGNYSIIVLYNKIYLMPYNSPVIENSPTDLPTNYGQYSSWSKLLDQYGEFRAGASRIYLMKQDGTEIVGTGSLDPSDDTILLANWDPDTYPTNTIIAGRGTIDAIVDPLSYNPRTLISGLRYLILGDIGNTINQNGARAWKNTDGSDFIAKANDLIEWDGNNWNIIFDASTAKDIVYVTNLKTGVQYKWDTEEWVKSFDGEYKGGYWRIAL